MRGVAASMGEASFAMSCLTSTLMISSSTRGVLATTAFHTDSAA